MSEERPASSGFGRLPDQPAGAMHRYSGWRKLRSMRTAIQLLIAVAAVSVIGSILPQRNNSAARVEQYVSDHRFWGELFDRLRLFDVFTAWWFLGLLTALLVCLAACLLPRSSAVLRHLRRLRSAPAPGGFPPIERSRGVESGLVAEEALAALRRVLRKRRWRLSPPNDAGQFVAEKGASREAGSLLFHWSLFLIVLGAALTITVKFQGTAVIVEGDRWSDSGRASYDEYSEGALAGVLNRHGQFAVEIDDFEVTYREDGSPQDFVTRARVIDRGEELPAREIRVNTPLAHKGVKLYQAGYGWAPVVRVRDGDRVLYDGPVILGSDGGNGSSTGVVKLPAASGGQAGVELQLYPDFRLVPYRITNPGDPRAQDPQALDIVSASDVDARPLVVVTEYRGDLGLDRPQSVYALDKSGLEPAGQRFATFPGHANDKMGPVAGLSGGLSVELVELRRFTVLEVKRDVWGTRIAGLGALFAMAGLYPGIYAYRRRVWVSVSDGASGGSDVRIGGVAFQRKELFEDEFAKLAAACEEALSSP